MSKSPIDESDYESLGKDTRKRVAKRRLEKNPENAPIVRQNWKPPPTWDNRILKLDPTHHISSRALRGIDDKQFRRYDSRGKLATLYHLLDTDTKEIIDASDFSTFLKCYMEVERSPIAPLLMRGLIEWFWDTTNTFHFPLGEMTITPFDYGIITGLPLSGLEIFLSEGMEGCDPRIKAWLGPIHKRLKMYKSVFPWSELTAALEDENLMAQTKPDQKARIFFLYLISSTFLAGKGERVRLSLLPFLDDLSRIDDYCWGRMGYVHLITEMRKTSRVMDDTRTRRVVDASMGGFVRVLEVWYLEHFPSLAPQNRKAKSFPIGMRWGERTSIRCSVNNIRQAICDLRMEHIDFRPWDGVPNISPRIQTDPPLDEARILLRSGGQLVWFLGERVVRQTYASYPVVPTDPPVSMLDPSRVSPDMFENFLRGMTARELVFAGSDYGAWIYDQLRPFPTFIENDEIEGWELPSHEIQYLDGFGNLVIDKVPFAEPEEEDVPYVPDNVNTVPKATINKVIKSLNAFRTAFRKTKHAYSCQSVTMARDVVPRQFTLPPQRPPRQRHATEIMSPFGTPHLGGRPRFCEESSRCPNGHMSSHEVRDQQHEPFYD